MQNFPKKNGLVVDHPNFLKDIKKAGLISHETSFVYVLALLCERQSTTSHRTPRRRLLPSYVLRPGYVARSPFRLNHITNLFGYVARDEEELDIGWFFNSNPDCE